MFILILKTLVINLNFVRSDQTAFLQVDIYPQMWYYFVTGSLKDDFTGADTAIYAALHPKLKGMSRGYLLRPRDKPRWPSRTARYI